MSAAGTGANNGDNKVTLAVLSAKLDIVIAKLDKVDCAVDILAIEQGIQKTQTVNIWKDIDDNIKPAIKRDTWLSGIAVVLGTLATALLTWLGLK